MLVTAFTHTAINNLLKRVHLLAGLATDIPDRQVGNREGESYEASCAVTILNDVSTEYGPG